MNALNKKFGPSGELPGGPFFQRPILRFSLSTALFRASKST